MAKGICSCVLLMWSLVVSAAPMTMDEFKELCGNGKSGSDGCVLYTRGLIEGIFERTRRDRAGCQCPVPPAKKEILEQLKANPEDTYFIFVDPFEVYGACVALKESEAFLEPSRLADAIIARYEEAAKDLPPANIMHLHAPSGFLVWVLLDEAKSSCRAKGQ